MIYNDFGHALGQAGGNELAYKVLKSVELVFQERVVLELNVADVLWSSDKRASKKYI
ncbi:hypothetical protein [Pseudomonas extremaustralis]|uniref:hypothetical protein n=1 Tax=Pseudomonas extremaustralis TaxID=359110 RepID=UPI002AA0D147|nr:hypothetical protein [Pseudomonas extremaustralis]